MFKNQIAIQVEIDSITFTKGAKSLRFLPYLYLDENSVVLSIGEPPLVAGESMRIDLFQEPRAALNYDDVLVAFLRHGIRSVLGRVFLQLRPSINFSISPDVTAYLRRFHKSVFLHAAIRAGGIQNSITFAD